MPSCSVPGCQSGATAYSHEKVQLFAFPEENKSPKLRSEWIDQIGRRGWKPTANSRVCSKHFKEDAFEENKGKTLRKTLKLKPRARPTEFLSAPPPQISNVKKKKQEQETQRPGPSDEHNYAPHPGNIFLSFKNRGTEI